MNAVKGGLRRPAMGGLIPPGMPGHSAGIGLPYDPDSARRLLVEAGYPAGRGFPTVEILAWPGSERFVEGLLLRWQENLGIETALIVADWATSEDRLQTEPPHMVLHGRGADYPDPGNVLRAGYGMYETGWRDKTYETLVEDARRVLDQGERMELYRQADRILVESAAVLPLSYTVEHLLCKPWAKVPVAASGAVILKDVIIEPH